MSSFGTHTHNKHPHGRTVFKIFREDNPTTYYEVLGAQSHKIEMATSPLLEDLVTYYTEYVYYA